VAILLFRPGFNSNLKKRAKTKKTGKMQKNGRIPKCSSLQPNVITENHEKQKENTRTLWIFAILPSIIIHGNRASWFTAKLFQKATLQLKMSK
jgi:hypothetical protein